MHEVSLGPRSFQEDPAMMGGYSDADDDFDPHSLANSIHNEFVVADILVDGNDPEQEHEMEDEVLPHRTHSRLPSVTLTRSTTIPPEMYKLANEPVQSKENGRPQTPLSYKKTGLNEHDPELERIFSQIHHCIQLRQKYLRYSAQISGENPRDKDSWVVYPPIPRPSWPVKEPQETDPAEEPFDFAKCTIPGEDDMNFDLDEDTGIFYVSSHGEKKYQVPDAREFFGDLNYILGVVSDGPTKSICFQRLQLLEAKWNMYKLMNEALETEDVKVFLLLYSMC